MKLNVENMSQGFIEQNRALLEKLGVVEPTLPPVRHTPPEEIPEDVKEWAARPLRKRYSKDEEKKLQQKCREELLKRGYIELTNLGAAKNAGSGRCWFGHLSKPQGNAFMPDLFIFAPNMRKCMMIELKTHHVYQVGQKEMIDEGIWVEATSVEEFTKFVESWEKFLLPGTGIGERE